MLRSDLSGQLSLSQNLPHVMSSWSVIVGPVRQSVKNSGTGIKHITLLTNTRLSLTLNFLLLSWHFANSLPSFHFRPTLLDAHLRVFGL